MLFADSEDPKIRKLLAEALGPCSYGLSRGRAKPPDNGDRPPRTEILWALRRDGGIPTAKAWASRSMPAGTTAPPGAEEIRKPSSTD